MDVSGMRKDECLLAIANYGLKHPKFELQVEPKRNEIVINNGQIFYGEFYVRPYLESFQWIYMEALKGIIKLKVDKKPTSNYIQYEIDGGKLFPGYSYEEEVTLYYPGGATTIEFQIKASIDRFGEVTQTQAIQHQTKIINMSTKTQHSNDVAIFFEKMTYSLEEAIELRLFNGAGELKSIMIESDHDLIHPKNTEFYLKDIWTQEWYIQQTAWDKIIGRVVFKETPFEEIAFRIHMNGENTPSQQRKIKTIITAYPLYETSINVLNRKMHRQLRVQCMRQFLMLLTERMPKKEWISFTNHIKGCLNFNQLDFDLRLIYFWALVDMGDMRSYEQEARYIRKYDDYFQKNPYYPIFLVFETIVQKKSSKRYLTLNEIKKDSHCLNTLIQTRYLEKGIDRYLIYRQLYEQKTRYAVLFAEAVHYLNKHEIFVEVDDQFYAVCIQWALNQQCLGKQWAHRLLGREKMWIRKNKYVSSRLLMQLYKTYPSPSLVDLCCEKAMEEQRYDGLALEYYKVGLGEGRYIKNLDRYYVEAAAQLGEPIDFGLLRYMTFIKDLSTKAKGYIYRKMIEAQVIDFSRFSRIYQELIVYLREMTHETEYMYAATQILAHIDAHMFGEHFDILEAILDDTFIQYLYTTSTGQSVLEYLIQVTLESITQVQNKALYERIESNIKPEGILLIYAPARQWYEQSKVSLPIFLDNDTYKANMKNTMSLSAFLEGILQNRSHEQLMQIYAHLRFEEQRLVRPLLCQNLCQQILIDDVSVNQEETQILQGCYADEQNPDNGLLLALLKIFPEHPCRDELIKRNILIPWACKKSGKTLETSIQYYGEPFDEIKIYCRYAEDEVFHGQEMVHIAYGLFVHPIFVFYGEYMEYYITKKISEHKTIVVVSDIVYEQVPKQQLDFIAYAMEVGDGQGTYGLIDEYLEHCNNIKKIFRI